MASITALFITSSKNLLDVLERHAGHPTVEVWFRTSAMLERTCQYPMIGDHSLGEASSKIQNRPFQLVQEEVLGLITLLKAIPEQPITVRREGDRITLHDITI